MGVTTGALGGSGGTGGRRGRSEGGTAARRPDPAVSGSGGALGGGRPPLGVGDDDADEAADLGQPFEVDERALRADVLGLALDDDVLARALVVPLGAHVDANHVPRA